MTENHIQQATFNRLFSGAGGGPLDAREFDAVHRHLDECRECRGRFARQQSESRKADEPLAGGQVETIWKVVMEKVEAVEAAPTEARAPAAGAITGGARAPVWTKRFVWGLSGAVAAVCAAFLLVPKSDHTRGTLRWRGATEVSPTRDLFCSDEKGETATPLSDHESVCPAGRQLTMQAQALRGFRHLSVVACTPALHCQLVDSQEIGQSPSVTLLGPRMEAGQRWTVFTIWSDAPIGQRDVDGAVSEVRRRGGTLNGLDALPLRLLNKQILATVAAGE